MRATVERKPINKFPSFMDLAFVHSASKIMPITGKLLIKSAGSMKSYQYN